MLSNCGVILEGLLDCKKIKPVNSKEKQYSLEGLILKLKLQHSGHLIEEPNHWRRLNLGKIAGKRRSRQQRMRWLDDITDSRDIV